MPGCDWTSCARSKPGSGRETVFRKLLGGCCTSSAITDKARQPHKGSQAGTGLCALAPSLNPAASRWFSKHLPDYPVHSAADQPRTLVPTRIPAIASSLPILRIQVEPAGSSRTLMRSLGACSEPGSGREPVGERTPTAAATAPAAPAWLLPAAIPRSGRPGALRHRACHAGCADLLASPGGAAVAPANRPPPPRGPRV